MKPLLPVFAFLALLSASPLRAACSINVAAINDGPMCASQPVTLTALTTEKDEEGFVYEWTHYNLTLHGKSVTTNVAGGWTVSVRSPAGCVGEASTTVVSLIGSDVALFPYGGSFCSTAGTLTVKARTTGDASHVNSGVVWTVEGSTIISGQGTDTLIVAAPTRALEPTSIRVRATGQTSAGCRFDHTETYTFHPNVRSVGTVSAPVAIWGGDTYEATLVIENGKQPTDVTWSTDNLKIVERINDAAGQPTTIRFKLQTDFSDPPISASWRIAGSYCSYSTSPVVKMPRVGYAERTPVAVVTAPTRVCAASQHVIASVSDFGDSGTYLWMIANGTITSGQAKHAITFTAPDSGLVDLRVTVSAFGKESATGAASVKVISAPRIAEQPYSVAPVAVGAAAQLAVGVVGGSMSYQWYEGQAGDTTRPVGPNEPFLTTPALTQPATYWVRVANDCGVTDSKSLIVAPSPVRHRAAPH